MAHLLDSEPTDDDVIEAWVLAMCTSGTGVAAARRALPAWEDPSTASAEDNEQFDMAMNAVLVRMIERWKAEFARSCPLREDLPFPQRFEHWCAHAAEEDRAWLQMLRPLLDRIPPEEECAKHTAAARQALDNTQLIAALESSAVQDAIIDKAFADARLVTEHSARTMQYRIPEGDDGYAWDKAFERGDVVEAGEAAMGCVSVAVVAALHAVAHSFACC